MWRQSCASQSAPDMIWMLRLKDQAVWPCVVISLAVLALVFCVPAVATWLPGLIG